MASYVAGKIRLPELRRRQLTPPLREEPAKAWNPLPPFLRYQHKAETADQSTSLLLSCLPPEIRHLIWSIAVGGNHFRLVHVEGKSLRLHSANTPGTSLLQTCRAVYAEVIPVLYLENAFAVDHVDTLICMTSLIPGQRLSEIRSLDFSKPFNGDSPEFKRDLYSLTYWNSACAAMTEKFTGLRELTIHLPWLMPGQAYQREWEPTLENMKYIAAETPLERFDVYVPWREDQCEQTTETFHLPFRLVSEIGEDVAAHPRWSRVVFGDAT